MTLAAAALLLASLAAAAPNDNPDAVPKGSCRCTAADWEVGVDYSGADIKNVVVPVLGSGSPQACCELCVATAGCTFWVIAVQEGQCWIKSQKGDPSPAAQPDRASGTISPAFEANPKFCIVSETDELSWGFVVIFAAGSMLYLGGGLYLGVKGGQPMGAAAHPHWAYLRALPPLVADGFRFSLAAARGSGGGGGGGYEAVEPAGEPDPKSEGGEGSAARFRKGQSVEYLSSSGWIAAKVLRDPGGPSLCLDKKAGARRQKVRARQEAQRSGLNAIDHARLHS